MSKYEKLWKYISTQEENFLTLTFAQIEQIAGLPIDHSFLKYKAELLEYGWAVKKIHMKEQTVVLQKGETVAYKWITREELEKIDTTELQSTFERDLVIKKGL